MLQRFEDWPLRLERTIAAAEREPFQWGRQDCALFACDAVLAMTGTDLAAAFRDRYADAIGAALALRREGGGGLEELAEAMAERHGIEEVAPAFAQRGDIVLADLDAAPGSRPPRQPRSPGAEDGSDAPALGICIGIDALFAGPDGLARRPMRLCRRAWRI